MVVTGFVCVFELGVIDEQPSERAITAAKMAAFPVSAARSVSRPYHLGHDKRGLSRCVMEWFGKGVFGTYSGCCSYVRGATFPAG